MTSPRPVISVLVPTRGRLELLYKSLKSLRDLAVYPDSLEFCVAIDPDEYPVPDPAHMRVHVAPFRYGYRLLHEYYNDLGNMATGRWLFIWNDDALMLTPGWDEQIRQQEPALLWPFVHEAHGMNVFPVVPAEWFRAIGHFSQNHSIDMWLIDVGSKLDRRVRHIDVCVSHRKTLDGTARERDITADVMTFHAADMVAQRDVEAAWLSRLLGPGNPDLVSVILPVMDNITSVIRGLIISAGRRNEIEFLVAGWNRDQEIRGWLAGAGLMGLTEVHTVADLRIVRARANGTHVVDWGTFEPEHGWDHQIRQGGG